MLVANDKKSSLPQCFNFEMSPGASIVWAVISKIYVSTPMSPEKNNRVRKAYQASKHGNVSSKRHLLPSLCR